MQVVRGLAPHQEIAVLAATDALRVRGRAQVVMPAGAGATVVGRAAAAYLVPDSRGTTLVLVPSRSRLFETLRAWRDTGCVADVLAVCSIPDRRTADPEVRISTSSAAIAEWLAAARSGPGARLLLGTYYFVPKIAGAFRVRREPLPSLDLMIFDDPHRGRALDEESFGTALINGRVPATRRLFLASPPGLPEHRWHGFGPRVYELGAAEAIERGLASGDLDDTGFGRMVEATRRYAADHGDTRPPFRYKTADGADLADWTYEQRRRYREGLLDAAQIAALEGVPGWSWRSKTEERWELGFEHLKSFARTFGHADVGQHYRAPDGYTLGNWVHVQRRNRDRMPVDQFRRLEAVQGWGWSHGAAYTERMLLEVARYYITHEPGPIPKDYRPRFHPDLTVGAWIAARSYDHSKGRLYPYVAQRLNAIRGFAWGQFDAAFDALLGRLRDYAARHDGGYPPPSYVAPDGFPLGEKVQSLRKRHRQGRLIPKRIEALERLPGWTWEAAYPQRTGSATDRFARGVDAVRAYADAHGTCAIPPGTLAPDGRDLALWASRRRDDYRAGRLDASQVKALEAIPGWYWSRREQTWVRGLSYLRAYVAEHGTADVPRDYVTGDGYKLGSWIRTQRANVRLGRMVPERAAVLESLPGWRWSR